MDQARPIPWTLDGSRCPSFIQSHLGSGIGVTFHREFVQRLRLCFLALSWMAVVVSKQFSPGASFVPIDSWEGPFTGGWGTSYIGK